MSGTLVYLYVYDYVYPTGLRNRRINSPVIKLNCFGNFSNSSHVYDRHNKHGGWRLESNITVRHYSGRVVATPTIGVELVFAGLNIGPLNIIGRAPGHATCITIYIYIYWFFSDKNWYMYTKYVK